MSSRDICTRSTPSGSLRHVPDCFRLSTLHDWASLLAMMTPRPAVPETAVRIWRVSGLG